MPGGAVKKGAVGVAAVAGLFSVRLLDDCGRVAGRGARIADDVVESGVRGGGRVLDDGLRSAGGGRLVAESVSAAPRSGSEWSEVLLEAGFDVTTEVLRSERPESSSGPALPTEVACPVPHDLTVKPEQWSKFLGGFGIKCAPAIFIARAGPGDRLIVDGETMSVMDMADDCWEAGGACLFVACRGDGRCYTDATQATYGARPQRRLEPFVVDVTRQVLSKAEPEWIAVATRAGEVTMLRTP